MNLRKFLVFTIYRLRGQRYGAYYRHYLKESREGISPRTTCDLLKKLLNACLETDPYYSKLLKQSGYAPGDDPFQALKKLPILTRSTIHERFKELQSADLLMKHWEVNSTGGSTGESIQFIQDRDFYARASAISLLFSKLIGKELGEKEIFLWGSLHDVNPSPENWRARLIKRLENETFLSAFHLDPDTMRDFLRIINTSHPKLITAYAGAIYELAQFAERQGIQVRPQNAIITSAGKLYPFMREKIEGVFQCRVYDRYGSREVGAIACELPGLNGMWVPPWGNYIEVVDQHGQDCPSGTEGNILVTCLNNYAMPFIRYEIGDRGVLEPDSASSQLLRGQVLRLVLGRETDFFVNHKGDLIDGMLFLPLLAYRDWIRKYQVVQKKPDLIEIRIMVWDGMPDSNELEGIRSSVRRIMAAECEVNIRIVDEIPVTPTGKFLYILSEAPGHENHIHQM